MRERFAREAAQDAFRRGYVHPADRNFRDRAPSFTQQKKSDTSESITARLMAAGLRGAV